MQNLNFVMATNVNESENNEKRALRRLSFLALSFVLNNEKRGLLIGMSIIYQSPIHYGRICDFFDKRYHFVTKSR